jgi:DNA-binding response OmpR family regulator
MRRTLLPGEEKGGVVGLSILVVEDEPIIMRLVKNILAGSGYEVLCATTAEEGLKIATDRDGPIDLLLADVILPAMLGTELAIKLKKARPAMRVILMSGKSRGSLSVLQGGWQFLAKPFMRSELLERIRAELEGKRT